MRHGDGRSPHPVRSDPLQNVPLCTQGYGQTVVFVGGQYPSEQHRPIPRCMLGVGIVILTVSILLLFCGILNFAGVYRGDHFDVGVPMMGFGGVLFLGGLSFAAMGCLALRHLERSLAQQPRQNTSFPPEQQPCNVEFNQSPKKNEFNHPPGNAPYGQPPGSAPYGQPQSSAPYGQYYNSAPYGQPPSSAPYGQPPGTGPYGQPPSSAPYGQPPSSAPYGQPPSSAPYGQPPSNAPYGQPASSAQSNWSPPDSLPTSAPPPYVQATYPGHAPASSSEKLYPVGFVVPGVTNP